MTTDPQPVEPDSADPKRPEKRQQLVGAGIAIGVPIGISMGFAMAAAQRRKDAASD